MADRHRRGEERPWMENMARGADRHRPWADERDRAYGDHDDPRRYGARERAAGYGGEDYRPRRRLPGGGGDYPGGGERDFARRDFSGPYGGHFGGEGDYRSAFGGYGPEGYRGGEERGRYARDYDRGRYDRDYGSGDDDFPRAPGGVYGGIYGDAWGGAGYGYYGGGAVGEPGRERGFFDRAGDEVASWFGDEEAERRRREDRGHRGRGPRGYVRSDERVREDVNDRLTDDPWLDASDMEVSVANCEVTLSGEVDSRAAKRRAEDIAEDVSGVRHVQNNLRIRQAGVAEPFPTTR